MCPTAGHLASWRLSRQRGQRIGRVITQGTDRHAVVVAIFVTGTPEEAVVGARDNERLGAHRVRHHSCDPRATVDDLSRTPSSYSTDASLMRSAVGRLTYRSRNRR